MKTTNSSNNSMKSFQDRQYDLKKEALSYIKSHIDYEEELHFYVDEYKVCISGQSSSDVCEDSFYIDSIDCVIAHCHGFDENELDVELDDLTTDTVCYIADEMIKGNVR